MEYDVHALQEEFMKITQQVATCQYVDICKHECKNDLRNDPPFPGFIGNDYKGLVFIGTNPGISTTDELKRLDRNLEHILNNFSKNQTKELFDKYQNDLANSMLVWHKSLVNSENRNRYNYNINNIAYINIVKCRTLKTNSNVFTATGKNVATRCFENYTKKQLEILKPQYIIFLWKPISECLTKLGYVPKCHAGAYNGQRNLKREDAEKDILPIFSLFHNVLK